jgi:2-polyprenyl-3-methyl-5-hydroxy-6-metoxy-1,4-benzoquinol methylase
MLSKEPGDGSQELRHNSGGYPFPFRKLEVSNSTISEVNTLLDWHAGTVLGDQVLGRLGVTANKRTKPESVPDSRIIKLDDLIKLTGKSILEVGCFEGIHTLGLRLYSDDVTAIDVRPSNVIKTLTRLSMHGSNAKVYVADVEKLSKEFGEFDLIFHCGVLYHLMSPVEHIFSMAQMCRHLFLDTHVAHGEPGMSEKTFRDFTYRGAYHDEGGWLDPFSGKDPKAFWLTKEGLQEALRKAGFSTINVIEERAERNGPRLAILASR